MFFIRQVKGDSMSPTLSNGQYVLAHNYRKFREGQVVVAFMRGREVIKRITAIENGRVFLQGDNPDGSTDSRQLGTIPDTHIEGVVFWPKSARLK